MLSQMIGCPRSISSRDGFQIELIDVTLLTPRIHHDRKKKKVFFMRWALVLLFARPVRGEGWLSELLLSEALVCCQAIGPKKNALNNLIIWVFLFPHTVVTCESLSKLSLISSCKILNILFDWRWFNASVSRRHLHDTNLAAWLFSGFQRSHCFYGGLRSRDEELKQLYRACWQLTAQWAILFVGWFKYP